MRAFVLTGHGGPEKLEYREDVPDPEPAAGEVRIRVGAAGLNNTDIWTREGAYGDADDLAASSGWRRDGGFTFPRVQGADVVGRIDAVGDGVDAGRIGRRVIVDPALYTGGERELVRTAYLGSERDGGFAELVTVPAANAHPVDGPLSDAELATFPTAYGTATRMLGRAGATAGETVLVTGASGGVGGALVQLAVARGCRVVALAGAGKQEHARALGASTVLTRGDAPIADVLRQAGEVDVVADVVAGPAFGPLLGTLAPLGRYVVAGAIAGPLVEADLRTVYLNQLRLIGSSFWSHQDFADLVAQVAGGRLTPQLARTYPLRDLHRAQADFTAKAFTGKLVVLP